MPRLCSSWLDSYMEYSNGFSSPAIYRRWTAISIVAGALERKTYVFTKRANLYPNLYIFLVGPPGVGKTHVLRTGELFWRKLEGYHVARTSVTKASLVDDLVLAKRNILRPGQVPPHYDYNSLLLPIRELGAFLTAYDNEFMGFLTDIYDNGSYSESRRSNDKKLEIARPSLNIIAGCTPSFLNDFLPLGAWDQGFMSRVLIVHSAEVIRDNLFLEGEEEEVPQEMVNDLRKISELFGQFLFTTEAKELINLWHKAGGDPWPEHPKLVNYNTRRTAHMLKLSMIISASRRDDMLITEEDFAEALGYLEDAELQMPDIFKVGGGGDSKSIDDAWYFVYTTNLKNGGKGVAEARLYAWLSQKVPAYSVARVIEAMVKSGTIKGLGEGTSTLYFAGEKPG